MKRVVRIDTVQWLIGIYIAIRGMLMLVVPHTLSTQPFVAIQPYFPWLGSVQVLGGGLLIMSATLRPRRSVVILAHWIAGATVLQAAVGHGLAGTWTATLGFSILGIGTAIAPFLPQVRLRQTRNRALDLFSCLMGIKIVGEGVLMLLPFNTQFNATLYSDIRGALPVYGIAHVVIGLALIAVNLYLKPAHPIYRAVHLLAGGLLWIWTASLGFPTWNSILHFGGLGLLLGLLPWLAPRLNRFDPASLKVRLAMTLVGLVALPLLLVVTLVTLPQEQATLNQAMALQRVLASTLSEDIANYIRLHRSAVLALANQLGFNSLSVEEQQQLLQRVNQVYPDIVVFTTYDASGNSLARSDDLPLGPPISNLKWYNEILATGEPVLEVRLGRVIQRPLFIFVAPVYDLAGQLTGFVGGAIESRRIAEHLAATGQDSDLRVYLVDQHSQVIAHPDREVRQALVDYSHSPAVMALFSGATPSGGLRYWQDPDWQLAGYARVPELEWGVVVERPAREVLAPFNARRVQDFYTLLLVALGALIVGSVLAQKMTKPLSTLAHATGQLVMGNLDAPLPHSDITEVAHLSAVFGAMRDHLAQRTVERDQATTELAQLLEGERVAREEAETANRIKDEFLAVLSHELRSPLNPILGWSKLLRSRRLDQQTTDRALETIERNAKLQTQLIEDLLDVSRILQGKMVVHISPVNLLKTVEAALEIVRLSAEAKGIRIQPRLDATVEPVAGDASRLQQVVWNLLSNAIKFTPSGGQVEVLLERVEGCAQIQVIDTGKGINPEFLDQAFDYFRQADGSITRQFGGLGLGLAIVRHLVELHGGEVSASSLGEGKGSTFTVRLPLLQQFPDADTPALDADTFLAFSARSRLVGVRILVVDDEVDVRDLLSTILQDQGAEVAIASSATAALKAIDRWKPDIILSDIGMPTIDGYTLMRQIRKLPLEQGGKTPAIALTAYAGEANQQQALAAGFQQHLAKPVDPATLVKAIAQWVERG